MIEFWWTWGPSRWFCCTYPFITRISCSGWLKCARGLAHRLRCYNQRHNFQQFLNTIWDEVPVDFASKILWQTCWLTCQTVPHSTNIDINGGLLLVSTMDCTTLILLSLLPVVVNNFDTISTKLCLICDEHWWDKQHITDLYLTSLHCTFTVYYCLLIKLLTKIVQWWVISR